MGSTPGCGTKVPHTSECGQKEKKKKNKTLPEGSSHCDTDTPVCLVTQSCPTLCDPMDCTRQGSSVHEILQARILEWVAMPSSRGSSQQGIEPRSPALQSESLLSEPPRKPMNIGVGSLSLLQGIFQSQDSNWGLLHFRMLSPSCFVLLIFMPLTGCHGSDS